jgi:3-deoxy-7-phosphoheptulonate synthase
LEWFARFALPRSHGEARSESRVSIVEKGGDRMIIGMREEARDRVRDQRIERVVELVPPEALLGDLPLGEEREQAVVRGRADVGNVLERVDDRLLVVVGPCSVHDVEAALEYAGRLAELASELGEDLLVAMRVYFEKPRTTTGWKGLINDPYLDGSCDVNAGLRMARTLLLQVLDLGLPVGCEFLDPITPQYISDTVSWGAIGARTTESQIHRQLGSGLSMPIGFKNRTDGDVQVAVDAVRAAAAPHAFAGIDDAGRPAILHTAGNPDGHVILRGGRGAPNCDAEGVAAALEMLSSAGLAERLVIDASHDNSEKDPEKQLLAVGEIADQVADGNGAIVGVMLESFLVEGRQDLGDGSSLTYGQSITDSCIAWEDTVTVLERLAAAVRARRG